MRGVQRGPFHDLPPEVAILTSVAFTVALGFGIVAPAIPLFACKFGVSVAAAASVISVFALMRVVGALPAGRMVDRFGELPDPLLNLISLQQARIKLGQASARAVTVRGDRLAVTPIELDSVRAKKIRAEIPEALYESGKSQLSVRVPKDPEQRFPAIVRAADVLLSVTREAA